MSKADIYLSVVIPAYNEAERIPRTLRRLREYLAAASFGYEILVVVDGTTDSTLDVLEKMSGEIPHLKILNRAVNRGKGQSVKEGMLKAAGRVRLFCDADNSTDIAHFDKMKPLLDEGYDLVIGSRDAKDVPDAKQAVPQPRYKRLLGQAGNLFVQFVAVRGIWDTQCGFKAFRSDAAKKIFSRTMIDGWGFDIEVLALARELKYKIGIIPVHWINDPRSHLLLTDYFRVLRETIRVRYNLLTGKYQI
ncbi:MAG TPA: dolichyl-phosphate beta-glucosyltransferase [Candidatus Binatia bacterium]|nr:dolichyl-phosphate beta-glucosyltransferase [Candidatus Binatia bacterium]